MKTTHWILTALLFFAFGCATVKETTIETTTETTTVELAKDSTAIEIRVIPRDTVIKYLADSTWLKASLECDSNNNVILKEIQELRSGNKIKIDFTFKEGVINVKSKINEDSIKVHWLEYYKSEYIEKVKELVSETKTDSKEKKVKKTSPFAIIKWILIAFVVGLVIGLTKKYWIKLIRGF